MLLLFSLALNSRIRDPFTFCLLEALKYSARDSYYKLIRRAYFIIIAKIPSISKDIALQMAFKAINNIVKLNKLVLTLLVYSIYLQITEHDPLLLLVT
jgi:hypothetical protein